MTNPCEIIVGVLRKYKNLLLKIQQALKKQVQKLQKQHKKLLKFIQSHYGILKIMFLMVKPNQH